MERTQSQLERGAAKGEGERRFCGSFASRLGEHEVWAEAVGERWMLLDRVGECERVAEPCLASLKEVEALAADYIAQEGRSFGTGPESFPERAAVAAGAEAGR